MTCQVGIRMLRAISCLRILRFLDAPLSVVCVCVYTCTECWHVDMCTLVVKWFPVVIMHDCPVCLQALSSSSRQRWECNHTVAADKY